MLLSVTVELKQTSLPPIFWQQSVWLLQGVQLYQKWYQSKGMTHQSLPSLLISSSLSRCRETSGRSYPPVLWIFTPQSLMWITSVTFQCVFLDSLSVMHAYSFSHWFANYHVFGLNLMLTEMWILNHPPSQTCYVFVPSHLEISRSHPHTSDHIDNLRYFLGISLISMYLWSTDIVFT